MNGLIREYEENFYILVQLSKCIEISNNDELLTKLYELKHWLVDEQTKINDFIENRGD
jgi:hypothetical protein